MKGNPSTSRKLASNTMYMYIRMFILLCMSLYTSRVILEKLGVSDYGIYNVVASIIAMFASVKALFTSAIQRFMNTEMGRGGGKLNLIFNTSVQNNVILSIAFIVIIEIIGLWFLKYKINIPSDRLFAAHCVFQLSICSAVIGIMATPYTALVIAHERMDIYSFFSIGEACLNLVILYLLTIGGFDKLIFYAVLHCLVQVVMRIAYASYSKFHYPESKFRWLYDKGLFKEMFSFAGWQFLGNTSCMLTRNCLNMMLNVFGSTVVNAAWGVSHQVDAGLRSFSNNVMFAINPHCMKLYGEKKTEQMNHILYMMAKILFVLQSCLTIPVIFFTEEICSIWLTVIPAHTIAFIRLMLLWSWVRSIHKPLDTLFKSHGKMRDYQIVESITLALPLLFSYIALKMGTVIEIVFFISILFEVINLFLILRVAKREIGMDLNDFFRSVVLPCLLSSFIPILITCYYFMSYPPLFTSLLLALLCIFLCCFCMYFWGLSKKEKKSIMQLKSLFIKKRS